MLCNRRPLSDARLITTGLLVLAGFGLYYWLQIGRLTTPLNRFAQHLQQLSISKRPQPFNIPPQTEPSLKVLFLTHNRLCQDIDQILQRARQFSSNVAHELRTPLTILKGETEIALRNGKSREQLFEVLGSNLEEISRMSRLIEDLLFLSKSELGEIPLQKEPLDLSEQLTELHAQARLLAESKGIQVEVSEMEPGILLTADRLRLRQVLLNLLANAVKYTPEGGSISISSRREGDLALISVADTGVGIAAQHLEHIFERFYRIDKTDNRDDGGSGLGLSIAKSIVDAHQGSINVSSVPGQGSCFTVALPLSSPPAAPKTDH